MENLINRITVNQNICHGKPVIRDTRHMVEGIVEHLAAGDSIEDVLNEFPDLHIEDILACLSYAAEVMKMKDIEIPLK